MTGVSGSGSGEGTMPPVLVASGSNYKQGQLHLMMGSGSLDAPPGLAAVSPDSSPNPVTGSARNTGTFKKAEPEDARKNIQDRVAARRACQEQVAAAVEDDPDLATFLGLADTPDTDPASHLQRTQRLGVGNGSQRGASALELNHTAPKGDGMSPFVMAAYQLNDSLRRSTALARGSKALGAGVAPGTRGFEDGINGQKIAQEVMLKTEYGRWSEHGKAPSRRAMQGMEVSAQGSNTMSLEEAWGTAGPGMAAGARPPLQARSPIPGIPFMRPAGELNAPQKDEDPRKATGNRPALMGNASSRGPQPSPPPFGGPERASRGTPEPLFLRCTSPSPPDEVKEKIARDSLMAAPAPMNIGDNPGAPLAMANRGAAPPAGALAEPPNSGKLMVCPFPLFAPLEGEVVERQRPKPAVPLFPLLPSSVRASEPNTVERHRTSENGGESAGPSQQAPTRLGAHSADGAGKVRLGMNGLRNPWKLQLHSGKRPEGNEMRLAQQGKPKGEEDADMMPADVAGQGLAMKDMAGVQPGEGSTKASAESGPSQGGQKLDVDNEGKVLDRSGSSQMPGIGAAVSLSADGNQAAAGGARPVQASEDGDCKSTSEGATSSSTSQVKRAVLCPTTISGGRPVIVHFGQDGAGSSLIGRRTSAGSGVGTPAIATALQQAQGSGSSAVSLRQMAPSRGVELPAPAGRAGVGRQGTITEGNDNDHAMVPALNAEKKAQVIFTKAEDMPLPPSAAAAGIAATATALGTSARRSQAVQQLPSAFLPVPYFPSLRGPPAPSQGSTDVLSLPRPAGGAGHKDVGPCMFQPYTEHQAQLKEDGSTPAATVGGTSVSAQVWLSRWLRPSAQMAQPAPQGHASGPARQSNGAHNRSDAPPLAPGTRPRPDSTAFLLSAKPLNTAVHAATAARKNPDSGQLRGTSREEREKPGVRRPVGAVVADKGAAAAPTMRSPAHQVQVRALQQSTPVGLEMSEDEIRQLSLQEEAGAAFGGPHEGPAPSCSVQDDSGEHLMGSQTETAADAESEDGSMDAESEQEAESAGQEEEESMDGGGGESGAAARHDEGEGSSAGVVPLADNWWQHPSRPGSGAASLRLHARAHGNVGSLQPFPSPAQGSTAHEQARHFLASVSPIESRLLDPTSAGAFAGMASLAGADPVGDNPFAAGNAGGALGLGGFTVGALEGGHQARRRSFSGQGSARGHQAGRLRSTAAAGRAAGLSNLNGDGRLLGAGLGQEAPIFDSRNTANRGGVGQENGLLFGFASPLEQMSFAPPARPSPCTPDLLGAAEMQLQRSISVLEREREALRAAEVLDSNRNNTFASAIDPAESSWEATMLQRMHSGVGAGYAQLGTAENMPFMPSSGVPFFAGLPDYTPKAPEAARQHDQLLQGGPPEDPMTFNTWNPAWDPAGSSETRSLDEFHQLAQMAPMDTLGNITGYPRSATGLFPAGYSGSDVAGGSVPSPTQELHGRPLLPGATGLQAPLHGGFFEAPRLFSAGNGQGGGMVAVNSGAQKGGAGRARNGYYSKAGYNRHRNSQEPPKFVNSRCDAPDEVECGKAAANGCS